MLFQLEHNKSFFTTNPSAKAIKDFAVLDSFIMKYICLVYDYESPLKLLSFSVRCDKAYSFIFKDSKEVIDRETFNKMLVSPQVLSAIREFKAMQRNLEQEIVDAYNSQIEEFIDKLSEKNKEMSEMDKCLKIMEKLPDLLMKREEIKKILKMRTSEVSQGKERKMSYIDKRNSN